MNIAASARQNAVHFEAKKTGFGQAQDGWSLTLRIQDNDVPANVRDARKGTRFMVALVEIADDETPVSQRQQTEAAETAPAGDAPPPSPPAGVEKIRRIFTEFSYPQQAGIRSGEPIYWAFLREMCAMNVQNAYEAADAVRELCEVESRRDIRPGTEAEKKWLELEAWFSAWQTKERAFA